MTVSSSGSKRSARDLVVLVLNRGGLEGRRQKGFARTKGSGWRPRRLVPETKEHMKACCT